MQVRFRCALARALGAAAVAAVLAIGAPGAAVFAQAPAPQGDATTAEADALRTRITYELMKAMDPKAFFIAKLTTLEAMETYTRVKVEPGQEAMLREAAAEEIDHDLPEIARLSRFVFTKDMSLSDLRATVAFLGSPAGLVFCEMFREMAAGRQPNPLPADMRLQIAEFLTSPAGSTFARGTPDFATAAEAIDREVAPGIQQRFKAKVEAAEVGKPKAASATPGG